MSTRVAILSAGAAESLVNRLRPRLADVGVELDATFGAVGAMRDAFLGGEGCELFITSASVLAEMRDAGQLDVHAVGDVGWVQTGVAVRAGDTVPDVSTPAALAETLRAAPELFSPDLVRATAGIHFSKILEGLGIPTENRSSISVHPNGATAMRALAAEGGPGAVGCTQVTEILQTEGVVLAGPLPRPHDLATRYQCARLAHASGSEGAASLFDLLTGPDTAPLRLELGLDQREPH